uniref:Uncharacterized protein n=1 Tax=Populus trichocarpa TaxID=3694 RepID=A0A3N7HDZ7_POPTR
MLKVWIGHVLLSIKLFNFSSPNSYGDSNFLMEILISYFSNIIPIIIIIIRFIQCFLNILSWDSRLVMTTGFVRFIMDNLTCTSKYFHILRGFINESFHLNVFLILSIIITTIILFVLLIIIFLLISLIPFILLTVLIIINYINIWPINLKFIKTIIITIYIFISICMVINFIN